LEEKRERNKHKRETHRVKETERNKHKRKKAWRRRNKEERRQYERDTE